MPEKNIIVPSCEFPITARLPAWQEPRKIYSPTGTPTPRRPQDLRGLGFPGQHLPSLFICSFLSFGVVVVVVVVGFYLAQLGSSGV